MVWLEGRLNPKEYISRGPEVWCIFKWVSPPFIWRGWKTWKTIFLRISCSYDSGYKLGFAKSCTWFERWKWGSGLLPVIFGITLERSYPQWCLFVLWLPEAASVGGGCCSLGTLSIAQISLVQYLLLLLLLQACGEQTLPTSLVPGASPCLVGAPKLAHTFAPDVFIELSSITLQGHYLLPDRSWPEKRGWLRWNMGSLPGWGARDVTWMVQRNKELLRNQEKVNMVASSENGVSEGWCAQQRPDL